jgi:glycine/serine hydroxymethyltransferase
MMEIADLIHRALSDVGNNDTLLQIREEVQKLTSRYPLPR